MNKWLENNVVIRIISVLLAGFLWFMVHDYERDQTKTQVQTLTKTIPITAEYNEKQFESIQSQKDVNITISGDPILIRYAYSRIRAYVDLRDQTEGEHRNVPVRVTGIPAGVKKEFQPGKITVTLRLKKPNVSPSKFLAKKLPIVLEYSSAMDEWLVEEIKATPSMVMFYGKQEVIDQMKQVYVPVELPKKEGIQRIRVIVPRHTGVEKVEPMDVEIYVKMKRAKPRQIRAIPLQLLHIGQGLDAQITSPTTVDVSVSGSPNLLNSLRLDQVEAVCDVANLPVGVHQVPIQIKLPEGIKVESQSAKIAVIEIRIKPNSTGT